MSDAWYYAKNGERRGPVDSATLETLAENSVLKRSDLIWKEGMDDWKAAGTVAGIFKGPLLPSGTDGSPSKKNTSVWLFVIIFIIIIFAGDFIKGTLNNIFNPRDPLDQEIENTRRHNQEVNRRMREIDRAFDPNQ